MNTTTKMPGNKAVPYLHDEMLEASNNMQVTNLSAKPPEGFPRRACLWLLTKEERAIYDIVSEVEKLGAHPLLTDVVVLLGQAKDKLSDWIEL